MTMTNLHYEKRALSIYCNIRAPNLIYNRYAKRVFVNYILDHLKQAKFLNHDDLPKHGEFCRTSVDFQIKAEGGKLCERRSSV